MYGTPLWCRDLDHLNNEDIISYTHGLMKTTKTVIKSNRGGWQSDLLNPTEFNPLFESVFEVVKSIEFTPTIEKMDVAQCWINVNKKHDWNIIHQHGLYHISGTYYVQVPENSGSFVIRDPRLGAIGSLFYIERFGGGEFRWFDPREGLLVMFPSFVDHMVEPSQSDKERISLSFDLLVE